jgi:hypothetical protein
MKTVADRIHKELKRLGYDYSQLGQFSVEITGVAVVVSQKIDLSYLTKQRDVLKLMFHMKANAFGAPLQTNQLTASLYRYPPYNNHNHRHPQILVKNVYSAPVTAIPTKNELYSLVAERLNIQNTNLIKLMNNGEQGFFQKRSMVKK